MAMPEPPSGHAWRVEAIKGKQCVNVKLVALVPGPRPNRFAPCSDVVAQREVPTVGVSPGHVGSTANFIEAVEDAAYGILARIDQNGFIEQLVGATWPQS